MAPKDERELYFAHTLDIAWIIALWHFIHGGDPEQDTEAAQTTELLARGLVGHMAHGRKESGEIIEKLNQLGIKMTLKSSAGDKEVRTTKEAQEVFMKSQGPIRACPGTTTGHTIPCFGPVFGPPHLIPHGLPPKP
jgi:hypothetical protein